MLSAPLSFSGIDAGKLFEFLYSFFHRDFVKNKTYLEKIYIDPQSHKKDENKELSFWHLTSRTQKVPVKHGNRWTISFERLPDLSRSERIEWVRQIITNHTSNQIKVFYHQETKRNNKILRLYLWAYNENFVVILQKLGKSSSFLVTSFFVDRKDKERDYESRYQIYLNRRNPNLIGCEWF